jgi:hypothetical protein
VSKGRANEHAEVREVRIVSMKSGVADVGGSLRACANADIDHGEEDMVPKAVGEAGRGEKGLGAID